MSIATGTSGPKPMKPNEMVWGSDAIAALLRQLDFPYALINPGASYRGLHDSLVNFNGNTQPELLLCLHEEHAVAIAHGYAKVTGDPLLVIVHSNVGLMHASMAIYNAFCDRIPIVILGATGPVDAAMRRPWMDWVHTPQDQGALVRQFTKWDDQPGSVAASLESIVRASKYARTLPFGPTYVVLDAALQEARLDAPVGLLDVERYGHAPETGYPAPDVIERAATLLRNAQRPVILAGRVSRDADSWANRILLAEALGALVVSDMKSGATFPTDHPLHCAPPSKFLHPAAAKAIREADVILNLDYNVFAGTMRQACGGGEFGGSIITCSLDRYVHNGWSRDHHALAPADLDMAVAPDAFVTAILARLDVPPRPEAFGTVPDRAAPVQPAGAGDAIDLAALATSVVSACGERDVCYSRLPLGMGAEHFVFRDPLDFLGGDGGGGVGSGPGMAVGAALALRGTGRLPIAIIGDGDYLMGVTALWTATSKRIPLLLIIANNGSYFNDEEHQALVARRRGRSEANAWIGQRIDDPAPDLAGLARSQGAVAYGPITKRSELTMVLEAAIAAVDRGALCVIDVRIDDRTRSLQSPSRTDTAS
jgi:thiamine pyrophosphate-dependent acetolactate synthase large subunit-like protein